MGAKKIIIPIAIAAVVACGVSYYCYSTANANTLSGDTISSSSTLGSSTISSSANTNVNDNSTKATSSNNETSVGTTTNINSTGNSNQSSIAKGSASETTSNKGSKVISSSNTENTSSNNAKTTQSISGQNTSTTNNTNGTTSSVGGSSSTSQTLSQLKEKYLNQLSEINDSANEINNKTKAENPSQYEVDNAEESIYQLWQGEVNTIYSQLQEVLPSSEFSKLQQDQESWIKSTNESAENYAEPYKEGSDYPAVLCMSLGQYYKARCYYLVDNYM